MSNVCFSIMMYIFWRNKCATSTTTTSEKKEQKMAKIMSSMTLSLKAEEVA